ncbi:hypothetical protein [Marinococcus sp. PL1-022]|uniref:hypothetical protein n=1 Tax=Marinococcus sp. PL1-022 TaxID=3095363 RepID=UPI0029C3B5AC|nr:hypothetical protein [Marinococcus sp. PL1-022]MDX6152596.1 hypothetical protein [Marinococcus sp. PL1-022]
MKKSTIILPFLGLILSTGLIGCIGGETFSESAGTQEASTNSDNSQEEESADTSSDQKGETQPQGGKESSETSSEQSPEGVRQELVMDEDQIFLPSSFPGHSTENVLVSVASNNDQTYSVQYQTSNGEPLVHVTGSRFASKQEAVEELESFQNGKKVGPFEQGGEDLGYGITGYGEGAAGSQYFSWEEGNWLLSLSSATEDEIDHPAVAREIVEYLESHTLPAPGELGVVDIHYDRGSEDVTVDIRWQDGRMVYELRTGHTPLEAMQMVTSMEK